MNKPLIKWDIKTGCYPTQQQLLTLYNRVGWTAYTNNPIQLKQAIDQSMWVITVFDNDQLIGILRVVGDGISIVYVQDIVIDPSYQNQGLGSLLLQKAMHEFKDVRQLLVMSDDNPKAIAFYLKNGLTKTSDARLVTYYRQ